jgi:hypothetical protein
VYDLQGELRSFPPPLLFQMMALGNLDGLLTLRAVEGTCRAYFQRGRLIFARGPHQQRTLGEELVHRGLVPREAAEAAAQARRRRPGGPRIGSLLVDGGHVPRADLEELIREQIKAAIFEVVEWREGRFTFETGVAPEDEDILLDVALESLLLEAMTRLDDARRAGRESGERRA